MPNPDIPDVTETDLTRDELEEAAEEVGVDHEGVHDQQLLERLGVALGEIDEDAVEAPARSDEADDDGQADDEGDDVQEAVGEPIDGPTRDELRDELRELDLPVSGTKDELAERLEEAKQDD